MMMVQDDQAVLEQLARRRLFHKRHQATAPEGAVDHVRLEGQELGDLGRILAGLDLGPHLTNKLHVRLQPAQRCLKVVPGVPAPGIVLVGTGHGLEIGFERQHIAGRHNAVGHLVVRGSEDVV